MNWKEYGIEFDPPNTDLDGDGVADSSDAFLELQGYYTGGADVSSAAVQNCSWCPQRNAGEFTAVVIANGGDGERALSLATERQEYNRLHLGNLPVLAHADQIILAQQAGMDREDAFKALATATWEELVSGAQKP